ncbi:MAG: 5-guanidino-2-oxopentanoate decarboxylase [Hyphomicrobiales bacterium]|nr:5-guanidino-2-oxopentanoate decarboxylase [Hyphomicrobiales bacterium]
MTLGEKLIDLLEAHGVDTVFGIPGVHTVELYRGLAGSNIRHVTPRHEQGAGFMADGYARASGRPGVAFVITGPGLTNAITAMGQARADSVPMLVISAVNATDTLGKGFGHLHELPDQLGLMRKVALASHRIARPDELPRALADAFALFSGSRPGPVHIEIPLDVMTVPADGLLPQLANRVAPEPDAVQVAEVADLMRTASRPLILAGGGAKSAEASLKALAEALDAPVVLTTNARGLLHGHRLVVPASPSLTPIRALMKECNFAIAVGTEFGPTDYDMYGDGGFVVPENLVRIDIDAEQLARHPARIRILADARAALRALLVAFPGETRRSGGSERATAARKAARNTLSQTTAAHLDVVETIRDTLPNSIIVGDSTQPVYAANLYYDHDRSGGWFNAATGYGTLGYGAPAAIGAALAIPDATVVCLSGDGGFQFTLPELSVAVDTGTAVIFVVWNNRGYREIETSMRDVGVEPVGVSPAPPDFLKIADAYAIAAERLASASGLPDALRRGRAARRPYLIEITVD